MHRRVYGVLNLRTMAEMDLRPETTHGENAAPHVRYGRIFSIVTCLPTRLNRSKTPMRTIPHAEDPRSLESAFDHIDQALPHILSLGMVEAAQGAVDEEHSQAVHR